MAKLKLKKLLITKPTMRTFDLEIVAEVEDELLDIEWTSHVTVTLLHGTRVIGEGNLRDTFLIPDDKNRVVINFHRFEILNVVGFKGFIQQLLPNDIDTELDTASQLTIADNNVHEGHELTLRIDMSGLSDVSVIEPAFQVYGGTEIEFQFALLSSNLIELDFGSCEFALKKGKTHLASLYGDLEIGPGKSYILLHGDTVSALTELSGMATLKGVRTKGSNNTWLAQAIRSLEIDVDMEQE